MSKNKIRCINTECSMKDTCDKFIDNQNLGNGELFQVLLYNEQSCLEKRMVEQYEDKDFQKEMLRFAEGCVDKTSSLFKKTMDKVKSLTSNRHKHEYENLGRYFTRKYSSFSGDYTIRIYTRTICKTCSWHEDILIMTQVFISSVGPMEEFLKVMEERGIKTELDMKLEYDNMILNRNSAGEE